MDLKEMMLEYFQRPQVNQLIAQYVKQKDLNYSSLGNDQLMNILEQLDILDPLLDQMAENQQAQRQSQLQLQVFQSKNSLKNLKIYVEKGRKFKQWGKQKSSDKFFVSISGFGQKGNTNSRPVTDKFTLGEQLVFSVDSDLLKTNNNQPLQLSVIIMQKSGIRYLYAVKMVEWRYVLAHGSVSFDIQLAQYNYQGVGQIPSAGILSLKLHLYPISKLNLVQPTSIDRQIQLQLKNRQKYNNQFYAYANQFWNQYKQVHKAFQSRRIKVYGDSEDKIFIPLCKFVHPLYNIRGIDSPQHAFRFCSLIPFQQEQINKPSVHKRFHSMISGMQGTIDDHCHLLCSLLLGFGLKSYVCIGSSYKGQHSWVITQDYKNGSKTFWQCTKGAKYDFFSPKVVDFYRNIHVVYNHEQYYANIQLDDTVTGTKYKFKENTQWKSLDKSFLQNIHPYNMQISLNSPSFDVFKIQHNIQNTICDRIEEYRKNNKLGFHKDLILASILSTALANYQIQRITGLTFCQDQFENAIKNYMPAKHTFKAFPIQLTTLDPDVIIESLKNSAKCRDILLTKGDSTFFGIRSKLVVYPDNIFALWLSIGVRYYKLG